MPAQLQHSSRRLYCDGWFAPTNEARHPSEERKHLKTAQRCNSSPGFFAARSAALASAPKLLSLSLQDVQGMRFRQCKRVWARSPLHPQKASTWSPETVAVRARLAKVGGVSCGGRPEFVL